MAEYKKDAEAGVATYVQPETEPERASGSAAEKPHAGDEDFGESSPTPLSVSHICE
jgi:hypothetical protein